MLVCAQARNRTTGCAGVRPLELGRSRVGGHFRAAIAGNARLGRREPTLVRDLMVRDLRSQKINLDPKSQDRDLQINLGPDLDRKLTLVRIWIRNH